MSACSGCRSQARLVVSQITTAATAAPRAAAVAALATRATRRQQQVVSTAGDGNRMSAMRRGQTRDLSTTATRSLLDLGRGRGAYFVVGATERLYTVCGDAANYEIAEDVRKADEVERLEDGEEVGRSIAKRKVWHELFNLPPTFSTWSHVTMLHLYILNARLRCFDREEFANWRQQLVDHFFFEAERKMHIDHGITSSALRQRYLKDIFVQWRGVMVAYDEGLVKGDAVLASAVWRNLFKGDPEADPRALAAIVGWVRSSLKSLESTSDANFASRAVEILELPVESFWTGIEKASKMSHQQQQQQQQQQSHKPAAASAPRQADRKKKWPVSR
ncbi:cytochrome b pre-mRNA-processing protein 3 [Geosmithia morbida]|uniref:Cytochrome b pre-mRNA-processing protein 3 n=1 Tax=Geosmithia morbida TaxID=1094350 RepID=A0A9P4YUD5_9HYPO|nr:cytochrome b pre-mRNA-processing protein 3 [Geosmithia morbida]KAF4121199.1 cytochrome b pre-mRNA-processing protein 3 [Geosmithia morbida]